MTQPDPATTTDTGTSSTDEADQQPDTATDTAPDNANSEAARRRVELREAQAARDALAERLTGYQRRECEATVADLLDVPADLWDVAQADVATFYNDDGTVNEDALRAAATTLVEQRPRLGKQRTRPQWGQHSEAPIGDGKVGWGDVIGR
jgi:hypothetical protein